MLGAPDLAASLVADLRGWWPDHPPLGSVPNLVDGTRSSRLLPLAPELGPGPTLLELVEHRRSARQGPPPPVGPGAFVGGLPHPDDWLLLEPGPTAEALEGCRRADCLVLLDADLDDERRTGSLGIEDRHLVARMVCAAADVLVAVGAPAPFGARDLDLLVRDLGQVARAGSVVLRVAADHRRALDVERVGPAVAAALERTAGRAPVRPPPPVALQPGELGIEALGGRG